MPEFAGPQPYKEKDEEKLDKKGRKKRSYVASPLDALLKHWRGSEAEAANQEADKEHGLWRKVVSLFKRSNLEIIPQPELVSDAAEVLEYTDAFETHEPNEPSAEIDNTATTVPESYTAAEKTEIDSGELLIDHSEAEEILPVVEETQGEQIIAPVDLPVESTAGQQRQSEAPESVGSIVERMSVRPETVASTARAQEYLLERQEKPLKRDVRRLKYRNRQQFNRQKALERRQRELEKQLKEGLEREALAHNLETVQRPSTPTIERAPERKILPPTPVATELHPLQFKELIEHKPESGKAEDVLERVEIAAKENVPIEQLYERRHEIKDESSSLTSGTRTGMGGGSERLEASSKRLAKTLESASIVMKDIASVVKPDQLTRNNPDLYQQSMKSGFWAAIVILVLIVLASLIK